MKIYNLDDVKKILQESNLYKRIYLINNAREVVVPPNAYGPANRDKKIDEIFKRLKSDGLKDGIYFIMAESSGTRAKAKADEYAVQKGIAETTPNTQTIIIQEKERPHLEENVLTYQKALERETELAQCRVDLEAAQRRIVQLETENELLKKEIEEIDEEHLGENENQSFWEKLAEMAMPMLDKHFELKERALNLEAVKLGVIPRTAPAKQAPQQNEQQRINELIQSYIMQFQDDPETYEAIAAIYNDAENLDDFLNKLQIFNPDFYNELRAKF